MNTQDSEKQTERFKGTKGKAIYKDLWLSVERAGSIMTIAQFGASRESTANGNLSAEAFNVVTETGMTPRQLQESREGMLEAALEMEVEYKKLQQQNDKMREALENLINSIDPKNVDVDRGRVGEKGVPADFEVCQAIGLLQQLKT